MSPGVRNGLAGFAGFVAAGAIIMVVQMISGAVFPLPEGIDPQDPEQLAAAMEQMPVAALLMVELSYVLGSFTGGYVAAKISVGRAYLIAAIIGVLLTLAGITNLVMLPHPLWFAVVSTLTYVPLALAGARIAAAGPTPR